ncbi:MAG: hypothetical protein ACREVD_02615, partial [Burkholderiales bacterium]
MRSALVLALAFGLPAAHAQTYAPAQQPQVTVQPVQTPVITNAPREPRLLELVPAEERAAKPAA